MLSKNGIDFVFKASFDKANRSSVNSYRGVTIEEGVDIFSNIQKMGLKTTTDIHEPWQAEIIADSVDIIQIPAFLSRQTDLLEAAAKTGKPVNVKKGQFMAPEDMNNVIVKLKHFGCSQLYLTERGTFFGYGRLVNDMTSIIKMKTTGFPVIFDATHSVQEPGGLGETSGGNREFVEPLAKAALAVGADGLFFEVHPDPDNALSDAPNTLDLNEFNNVLKRLLSLKD
jgi:2-dehydro-3-deoxyphosphooctonate aldolase (KDO 8-P synthase)